MPLTVCLSSGVRPRAPLCSSALSLPPERQAHTRLRRQRCRPFTLLEILAAAAMFAVMAAALTSVFFATMRLRVRASERLDEVFPPEYVEAVMRKDFQALLPPPPEDSSGLPLAGEMLGEKEQEGGLRLDRIEFHAAAGAVDDSEPWGDVLKVEYRVEGAAEGNGLSLVRSVTRNLLAEVIDDPDEHVLVSGVQSFELSYFDGDVWADSWDSTVEDEQLPKAIKVRVDFLPVEDKTTPSPIEVVAAVLVQAQPSEEEPQ